MKMARDKGMKVGLFRPITLWPFPKKALAALAGKAKKFLVVEMSMGQFVDDVRLAVCGRIEVDLYARPSGIPSGDEVFAYLAQSYKSIPAAPPESDDRSLAKAKQKRKFIIEKLYEEMHPARGTAGKAKRGRPKGSKNKTTTKPGRPAKNKPGRPPKKIASQKPSRTPRKTAVKGRKGGRK
jgi:hypothetical protein